MVVNLVIAVAMQPGDDTSEKIIPDGGIYVGYLPMTDGGCTRPSAQYLDRPDSSAARLL